MIPPKSCLKFNASRILWDAPNANYGAIFPLPSSVPTGRIGSGPEPRSSSRCTPERWPPPCSGLTWPGGQLARPGRTARLTLLPYAVGAPSRAVKDGH